MRDRDPNDDDWLVYFCDGCSVSTRSRRGTSPDDWLVEFTKDLCPGCRSVEMLRTIAEEAQDPEVSGLAARTADSLAVTEEVNRLLCAGLITAAEARRRLGLEARQ